jgi:hypothetical protein
MITDLMTKYNKLLESFAEDLDITPAKYQEAVQRYSLVGKWLDGGYYPGCYADPKIYPQGSFRLGTVVRPLKEGKESDYDIDLVCELQKHKSDTTPNEVKKYVGNRLKENGTYRNMLESERRRCWTLNYAAKDGIGFHMDVLPSIPEEKTRKVKLYNMGVSHEIANKSIAITHKDEDGIYSWKMSNPNGYAEWFDLIKMPIFNKIVSKQKEFILENNLTIFEKIDDVSDQLVRTPLQRSIQILKRHRDMRFAGNHWEGDKPISMIISTLAALFYEQEEDIYSTLKNIVEKLEAHANLLKPGFILEEKLAKRKIIFRTENGEWKIPNPVNPGENFADRWHENNHIKAKAFFQWVSWVRDDLVTILGTVDINKITKSLSEVFGESAITKASSKLSLSIPTILVSKREPPIIELKNPGRPWGCCGK